jgi:MFS family permease
MSDRKIPPAALWALGLTQIVGYGTLYYSFSILVPDVARDLAWSAQWVFGALSAALIVGGFFAPTAGKCADRFGAGRVMTFGSTAAAFALFACALAPGKATFVLALVAMELASSFVLYSAAFVAIVQFGGTGAQQSITHLTLIAGFASTLFWPLTTAMHLVLSWREV